MPVLKWVETLACRWRIVMDLMHTIAWQIQYDLLLAIPWGEKEHTHTHLQPVMWQLHLSPKTLKINVYVYTPSSNHLCSGKKTKSNLRSSSISIWLITKTLAKTCGKWMCIQHHSTIFNLKYAIIMPAESFTVPQKRGWGWGGVGQ